MARQRLDPDRVVLGEITATPMGRGIDEQGKRYWRARLRGADRRTLWTGWATRAEVETVLMELHRKGIPARPKPQEGVRTVADLLRLWTEHQELRQKGGEIAQRTLENYRRAASYWRGALGDLLVGKLSRDLVEDTLTRWQAAATAARTAKQYADIITAAVNWGEPRGHCGKVELQGLAAVRVDDDEHVNNAHTPTRLELAKVLAKVPRGRDRNVILLLALTGARAGEIMSLRVRDWDRESRTLSLCGRDEMRQKRGKVKVRRWPVAGELANLLERLAGERDGESPLVQGLPLYCGDIPRATLEDACAEASVPRFTAHGLRRMVAMELLECADPRRVSELTGHSVATLLRHYVRPRAEDLRELVIRSGMSTVEERGKVFDLEEARRAQKAGTRPEDTL